MLFCVEDFGSGGGSGDGGVGDDDNAPCSWYCVADSITFFKQLTGDLLNFGSALSLMIKFCSVLAPKELVQGHQFTHVPLSA